MASESKTVSEMARLAAAVELNSAEWLRLEGALPWVQLHEDPDSLWLFAGDGWPRNHVALARFSPANADRRIGEILSHHLRAKVACNWVVGPLTQPTDLGRYLKARGFSCRIHCAGMACDLRALPPSPTLPDEVKIQLVETPPSLVRLTTERRRLRHRGRTMIARMTPRRVWHFAAYAEGTPVGETTLLHAADFGGLYNVEVRKEYRRRGIGSALVDAALRQAKKLGCETAVLGATGLGSGVYARRGFREVCRLSFWKYGKMRQLAGYPPGQRTTNRPEPKAEMLNE